VRADLGSFELAGKTGTSRRIVNGRYAQGQHISSFVGLFPADRPQVVILVKIINPRGAYVGGLTAAPVTKAVIEAALASRNAALDRGTLAASRRERVAPPVVADTVRATDVAAADHSGPTPFVALLPAPKIPAARPLPPRAVPAVEGMPIRRAVHALNSAGFRVQLVSGSSGGTIPAAGTVAPAGTLVRLPTAP
jgi:cell division protein FtsI (penicillin-binding protein 3)